MAMDEKNKQQYICQEPTKCPYCIMQTLVRENITKIGDTVTCDVFCSNCNNKWKDVYRLMNGIPAFVVGGLSHSGENVTCDITCPKCNNTWKNIFELVEVIE